MKKQKTKKIGTILVMALMLTFMLCNIVYASVAQNGTDVKFTKHKIDSNEYTEVAQGAKINAGKTLYAQVTHMYDTSGNEQNLWTKSKWKVYDEEGNIMSDEVTLSKGTYTGIALYEKVTSDNVIVIYAMANMPFWDAKISGYLYNFTKE